MNRVSLIVLFLVVAISCSDNEEFRYLTVVTGNVEYTEGTSAAFNGVVDNQSGQAITESGFILSLRSHDDDGLRLKSVNPNEKLLHEQTTAALRPGKVYYVRAYIVMEGIITYGNELTFKTSGQENIGRWSTVVQENSIGWCVYISSVFTLGDQSYIIIQEEGLYKFNHTSGDFTFILNNDIIQRATHSFIYNNEAYIFSVDRFYKYNPANNALTGLSVWPAAPTSFSSSSFIIGDAAYIGLGQGEGGYRRDFWKFSFDTNTWIQVADFPGTFRASAFTFALDNQGFVGGGFNLIENQWPYPKFDDFWGYDPVSDKWTVKDDLPFNNDELFDLVGVANEGYGYCFYQKQFFEYKPEFNAWEPMANVSTTQGLCYPKLFSYNNKVFLIVLTDYSDDLILNLWSYEK